MAHKKGIRQQYIKVFIASIVIAIIGMASMYFYASSSWDELENKQQASIEKSVLIENISDSIQDLFFRVRGYYAFQIEEELNFAYQAIEDIHSYSSEFKSLQLTAEEQRIIDEIDNFLMEYENVTLPKAIQYVKKDDYAGLQDLAKSGTNLAVNSFIQYANEYEKSSKDQLENAYNNTMQKTKSFFLIITLFGIIFLCIPIYMFWSVVNRVVKPVEDITRAADQYETEGTVLFQPIQTENEIGALSQSIHKMMEHIQMNEQELLSQNEELITQQDELFNRQTKMEFALSEARFSRVRLERYNGLSHILSFSLDKQEVCDQTSCYLNQIYQSDLSFLWFPKSEIHTLKGISEEFFNEIKQERIEYIKIRLETEPYFIIKREAEYEKGIADNITYVYDFVTGIYNVANELSVVSVLSRIGKPFTEDDQQDLYGLLKRIAIAVDRIEQYELIIHERQLNQNILDNINEGIRFVSNTSENDKYNKALFNLLGMEPETEHRAWPREEWTEYFLKQIDDPVQYKAFFDDAIRSESTEFITNKYILSLPSEKSRVMNVYSVPIIIQEEKVGTIFVHRDITHEHEVNKMKTELVSTVSHELRTPLSSILGFSELLLNKDMDDQRKKRYLETIHSEANRLTTLINDFLDLQRMESGRQSYKIEDISITKVAEMAVDYLLIQSPDHTIKMQDLTYSSMVRADYDRILQVFMNLIGNAIKFSPDGGNVNITLLNQQDTVVVSIADEGIGIPSDTIKHLFEKFYRFDNSYSRKIGGTGLGLSICKEIIQDHHGRIWVSSEENVGTTIFFSLPLKQQLPNEKIDYDKPLVVIVEDDVNISLLLGEELASNGFSIIHHSKVGEAFVCIEVMQPAAVVVDLKLEEGENGWDLISQMKEHTKTKSIPIIISSSLEKEPLLMEEFHISEYLTKPYPLSDLSSIIIETIERSDGLIFYPENN
ncbi:histidine kinase [Sporosarcina sp. P21c]|uniref:ATP-binding protein n=1 Tax=unclassified Sporosarcina TaxID=2647733 RepID=UPI000C164862|nr:MULTISPECIES: ATP-binding protein [unclassified Sporosarcina]PIC68419.1 histidine kinase [Sporosarcina sp. P16a]PIC88946.1 histidine kinase [Sporosarcina sp. P21c]PIC92190.1 histidine kinase [Sporosarcina sp. P25]